MGQETVQEGLLERDRNLDLWNTAKPDICTSISLVFYTYNRTQ